MPDLSRLGVHAFWHEYDRRTLYRIMTSMEGVETWAVDQLPEVDNDLVYLGTLLEEGTTGDIQSEATVVNLLAGIHSGRALRLMQFLDVAKPGTASKLLVYAEEATKDKDHQEPHAELFLKRNLAFERLQLLARVFAPERVNLVLKALEKTNE